MEFGILGCQHSLLINEALHDFRSNESQFEGFSSDLVCAVLKKNGTVDKIEKLLEHVPQQICSNYRSKSGF